MDRSHERHFWRHLLQREHAPGAVARGRALVLGLALLAAGSGCGSEDDDTRGGNTPWGPGVSTPGMDGSTSVPGGGSSPDASTSGGPAAGDAGPSSGNGSGNPPGNGVRTDASSGGTSDAGPSPTRDAGSDGASPVVIPDASVSSDGGGSVSGPVCMAKVPAQFELNTAIGGRGTHKDSAHFALYGSSAPDPILNFMEAAHKCFIEDWCFRTPGLSVKSNESGPYYKTNIVSSAALGAGGLTHWDPGAMLSYIEVLSAQAGDPRTTVHEYGHAITMSEYNWIEQKRTGFWWETVANWVSYSFLLSPHCENARNQFGIKPATTIIDQMHTLATVYNGAHTVICNDQNYYQAWPFLTYLTNNPDNYPGLGKLAVQDLMRKYQKNSNETPLHTLGRIAAPVKVQTILGRYWARMAYMDIDLPVGQKDFLSSRGTLKFAGNLDASGADTYTVKAARRPQYGGANINPLSVSGGGNVSVTVTNLGNGLQESNFTATLSIRASSGAVRYVDLPNGTGQATIASGEEASLVVVNTPNTLYQFDPQYIRSPENVGLNYKVQISGATPN